MTDLISRNGNVKAWLWNRWVDVKAIFRIASSNLKFKKKLNLKFKRRNKQIKEKGKKRKEKREKKKKKKSKKIKRRKYGMEELAESK